MPDIEVAEANALAGRKVVWRDYVWMRPINRNTLAPVDVGFWNGEIDVAQSVVDGITGSTVSRNFLCDGLVEVGSVYRTSDLSVSITEVRLSAIDTFSENSVRGYDARGCPIQIYRGFFNPDTMVLVANPKARFVGIVDEAPIETSGDGRSSLIVLKCASHSRELTRQSTDVRSYESQIARHPGDAFYKDVATIGDRDFFWGRERNTPSNLK